MPIEVRELVIKAVIGGDHQSQSGGSTASAGGQDQDAIIQSCVEKVLDIIRKNMER